MKLKQQKYLILLVMLLCNISAVFADGPTPPPPPTPGPGLPPPPDLPIDSGIVILFIVAIIFGAYKILEIKKRQFEN